MGKLSIRQETGVGTTRARILFTAVNISPIVSIRFELIPIGFLPGYQFNINISEEPCSKSGFFNSLRDFCYYYSPETSGHDYMFYSFKKVIVFLQKLNQGISQLSPEDNDLLLSTISRIMPQNEFDDILKEKISSLDIDNAIIMILSRDSKVKDLLFYCIGNDFLNNGHQEITKRFYENISQSSEHYAKAQLTLTNMLFENVSEYNIKWFLSALNRGQGAIHRFNKDIINQVLANNDTSLLTGSVLNAQFDHALLIHVAKLIAECNQQELACEWLSMISNASSNPEIKDECNRQLTLMRINYSQPNDRLSYFQLCMSSDNREEDKANIAQMKQLMELEVRSDRVSLLLEHILKVSLCNPDIFYFAGCIMAANDYPLLAFCFFERVNEHSDHFQTAQFEYAKLIPTIHSFFAHTDLIRRILECCLNAGEEHISDSVEVNKNLLLGNSACSSTKKLLDEISELKAENSRLRGLLDRQSITSLVRSGSSISSLREGKEQLATSHHNVASCSTTPGPAPQ